MAYPVTKVITEAYFDSGVVARQFEELQGYQLNDGLDWLNQVLGDKAMDTGDIPYITTQYPLIAVAGQEKYFIPNCISIDVITFYISNDDLGFDANSNYELYHNSSGPFNGYGPPYNVYGPEVYPPQHHDITPDTVRRPGPGPRANSRPKVRYQMNFVDRNKYFGQPRAENINALPVSYTYERVPGGVNLWVYFPPQNNYLFHVTGNFFMQQVSLNQDLTAQTSMANLGTPFVSGAPSSLGVATILGTGALATGELVINGIDLAGTYATPLAFVNEINTGIVPGVTATLSGTTVTLVGTMAQVTFVTLGTVTTDGITFTNFGTNTGPLTTTFNQPGGLRRGGLVINGVDMMGSYTTIGALVTAINTKLSAAHINVSASVTTGQNAQFILTGIYGQNIFVATNGWQTYNSTVSFSYFNTTGRIPLNQAYIALSLDQFYINYLEYQLAERICQKLNFTMPEAAAEQLARYRLSITKLAEPLDLVQQRLGCLAEARGLNYASANIGRGYGVSGF